MFAIMVENGINRYTMTSLELGEVYRKLENFVADCTTQEYIENKEAINSVLSLIHTHMQYARREHLSSIIYKYAKQVQEGFMLDVMERKNLLLAVRELSSEDSEYSKELVEIGKKALKRH